MAGSPVRLRDVIAQAETEDLSTPTPIPEGVTPYAPQQSVPSIDAAVTPRTRQQLAPQYVPSQPLMRVNPPAPANLLRNFEATPATDPNEGRREFNRGRALSPSLDESGRAPKTGYFEVRLPDGGVDYIPDNLSPEEAGIELRKRHQQLQQGYGQALLNSGAQGALVDAPKGVLTAVSILQGTPFADDRDMQRIEQRFQQFKDDGRADMIEADRVRLRQLWGGDPSRLIVVEQLAQRALGGQGPRDVTRIQDTSAFKAGQQLDQWGQDTFPVMPENAGYGTGIARGVGQMAPMMATGLAGGAAAASGNVGLRAFGAMANAALPATFAGMNIGESVENAVKAGATDEQIRQAAIVGGVPAAMLDFLSFQRLMKPLARTPGALGFAVAAGQKAVEQGLTEGSTEWVQNVVQNLAARGLYAPEQDPFEGGLESFVVGAGVGAITGGGSAALPGGLPQPGPSIGSFSANPPPPAAAPGAPPAIPGAPAAPGRVEPTFGTPGAAAPTVDPSGRTEPNFGTPAVTPGVVQAPGAPVAPPQPAPAAPVQPPPAAPVPVVPPAPEAAPVAPQPGIGQDLPDQLGQDEIDQLTGGPETTIAQAPPPVMAPPAPPPPPTKGDLIGDAKDILKGFLDGTPPVAPETPVVPTPGDGTATNPIDLNADPGALGAAPALPEPTPAQAEAGNYKKYHVGWNGLDLAIETRRGEMRRSKPGAAEVWEVQMPHDYGYVKATNGADGDQVDIYLGPDITSPNVFVIDQIDPKTGKFDEHKVMLGFADGRAAAQGYEGGFSDGSGAARLGAGTPMSVESFKAWLASGKTKAPLSYKPLTPPEIHTKADALGVPWSTPAFMGASERLTGQKHLDDMNPAQLDTIWKALGDNPQQFIAPPTANVLSEADADAAIDDIFGSADKPREGWQITRDEVRRMDPQTMERLFWKPAAERIYRQAGTTKLQEIANYYAERYGVTALKIKTLTKPFESGPGGLRITHGMVTGVSRPDGSVDARELYLANTQSEFEKLMTLRHEIEHLIDWKNGFNSQVEAGVKISTIGGKKVLQVAKGHHQNYDIFNYDYPHRIVVRDALEAGLPVPEDVLRDYPDLVADYQKGVGPQKGKFGSPSNPDVEALAQHLSRQLIAGENLSDIRAARKLVNQLVGGGIPEKRAEEIIELGVVMAARHYAQAPGQTVQVKFDEMVDLYERQPRLITRTVDSSSLQAYSTPAPLAYVASRLATIDQDARVLEPTAGNGMLLIEANPANTIANEIQTSRQNALSMLGFKPEGYDATQGFTGTYDVVITNPPFGKRQKDGGRPETFNTDFGSTEEIDHAIVAQALQRLTPEGRAVLIIGSKRGRNADGNAYAGKHAPFYKQLYDRFNVADHFVVAGELYERQGAGFPVDVIVIEGRKDSKQPPRLLYPQGAPPPVVRSWADLKGVLNDGVRINNQVRPAPEPVVPPSSGPAPDQRPAPRPQPEGDGVPDGAGGAPQRLPTDRPAGPGPGTGQGPDRPISGPGPRGPAANPEPRAPEPERPAGGPAGEQPVVPRPGPGTGGGTGGAGTGGGRRPVGPAPGKRPADDQAGGGGGVAPEPTPPAPAPAPAAKPDRDQKLKDLADKLKKLKNVEDAAPGAGDERARLTQEIYNQLKPVFTDMALEDVAEGKPIDTAWIATVAKALEPMFADAKDRWPLVGVAMKRWFADVREGRINLDPADRAEVDDAPKVERDLSQSTDLQVQYVPRASNFVSVGTLVPKAMMSAVDRSLDNLVERLRNGNDKYKDLSDPQIIERFIEDRLGYKEGEPRDQGYFSAEQADALAMAIDSHERGGSFIVGDQTGVGKGRIVAGMLRYAAQQKLIPIFVTAKPGLYSDMYRDLNDIGWGEFNALPTNRGLSGNDALPLPGRAAQGEADGDRKLTSASKNKLDQFYNHMLTRGELPEGYDALFTTYSQMMPKSDAPTIRQSLLKALSPRAMIVLDESHEAGGVEDTGWDDAENSVAKVMRAVAEVARGIIFSSATFAKRAQTMSLYGRTTMSIAVDGKMSALETVLNRGGVPMQQVLSQMLVEDGQYIRREKSFEGIEIKNEEVAIDEATADENAALTREIFMFDEAVEGARAKYADELNANHGGSAKKGEVSNASTTGFSSVMHNIVAQSLLSMKAEQAANAAIESWKRGEKPILTVSNTMGSILEKLQEEGLVKPGERLTFKDVYRRYLKKTMTVTIFEPADGKSVRRVARKPDGTPAIYVMSNADLVRHGSPSLVSHLRMVEEAIVDAKIEDMPLSPIDHMLKLMADAGMKVGEITGRKATYDQTKGEMKGREDSQAIKKRTMNAYNGGDLDALIINRSGSTGFSLHASKTYKDQKPRRMFIVQGEANINDYVQMLGRINRTGQVVLPGYSMLVANVPAEKRPAAVIGKKLAALNANTTAARKGAYTNKETVDFFNQVGGEAAREYLIDNMKVAMALDIDLASKSAMTDPEKLLSKLTGRAALLPVKKRNSKFDWLPSQVELFDELQRRFEERIAFLNSIGENPLEAKTVDLKAKTISEVTLVPPKSEPSVFANAGMLEQVEVDRQFKPMNREEFSDWAFKNFAEDYRHTPEGGTPPPEVGREWRDRIKAARQGAFKAADKFKMLLQSDVNERDQEFEARIASMSADQDLTDGKKAEDRAKRIASLRAERMAMHDRHRLLEDAMTSIFEVAGVRIVDQSLPDTEQDLKAIQGIVGDFRYKKRAEDPTAFSNFEVEIATAGGESQTLQLKFSQLFKYDKETKGDTAYRVVPSGRGIVDTLDMMEKSATNTREIRYMLTGNLISSFAKVNDGRTQKGQFVMYTTEDGEIRPGVFLPASFKPNDLDGLPANFTKPGQVIEYLNRSSARDSVHTQDKAVVLSRDDKGAYVMSIKAAGNKGIWDNAKLRAAMKVTGDEKKSKGNYLYRTRDGAAAEEAIAVLMNDLQLSLQTTSDKKLARKITGEVDPSAAAAGIQDKTERLGGSAIRRNSSTMASRSLLAGLGTLFKSDQGAKLRKILDDLGLKDVGLQIGGIKNPLVYGSFDTDLANDSNKAVEALIKIAHWAPNQTQTLYHEAIHAMRALGLFTPQEWATLTRLSEGWQKKHLVDVKYRNEDAEGRIEEGIAFGLQEILHDKRPANGILARIMSKIQRLADGVIGWLRGQGWNRDSADMAEARRIADKILSGEIGARARGDHPNPDRFEPMEMRALDPRVRAIADKIEWKGGRTWKDTAGELLGKIARIGNAGERKHMAQLLKFGLADAFDPIRTMEKEYKGRVLDASESAWKMALMSQNLAQVMDVIFNRGPVFYDATDGMVRVRPNEKGLTEIFKRLNTVELQRTWAAFAVAVRADRLEQEGRENLLTRAEIDQALQIEQTYPWFRQIFNDWNRFNSKILDFADQAGLINSQQRQLWEKADYIPFYRMTEDETVSGPGGKSSLEGQRSGIKTLRGGDQQINDIYENIVRNVAHMVDASYKNLAMQRATAIGVAAGVMTPAGISAESVAVPLKEAKKKLEKAGIPVRNLTPAEKNAVLQMWAIKPSNAENVVSVMIGGKPKWFKVSDPLLLQALRSFNFEQLGMVMRALRGFKQVLTRGVTMTPDFLAANFMRDSISAWAVSGERIVPIVSGAKWAIKELLGRAKTESTTIQAAGAAGVGYYGTGAEALRQNLEDDLRRRGVVLKDPSTYWRSVLVGPKALWKAWDRIGQAGEMANRLAVYEAVRRRGGSEAEAAFQSRDLLNFTMRGGWALTRQMIAIYPFLNARIQGLYKMGRVMAENPKTGAAYAAGMVPTMLARGLILMAITQGLQALYMGVDELKDRYLDIPEWDKDANYHILLPKAWAEQMGIPSHYRLPKAFELSLLFSTIPERAMNALTVGGREWKTSLERIGQGFLQTLALNPIPQAVLPLVELDRNRSFFFDRQIVNDYLEKLPPEQRTMPWTTSTAMLMSDYGGKHLGLSPIGIEHLVRGYGGGMAMYAMAAADVAANLALDRPPQAEKRVDQLPVVNRFVRLDPVLSTKWGDEFYKLRTELDMAMASQREARKNGTAADEEKVETRFAKILDEKTDIRRINRDLQRISREMRDVNANRDMTPAEKRQRLDALIEERNTVSRQSKDVITRMDAK
jgi:hypothetical protein